MNCLKKYDGKRVTYRISLQLSVMGMFSSSSLRSPSFLNMLDVFIVSVVASLGLEGSKTPGIGARCADYILCFSCFLPPVNGPLAWFYATRKIRGKSANQMVINC
jgi:hypothetical protein